MKLLLLLLLGCLWQCGGALAQQVPAGTGRPSPDLQVPAKPGPTPADERARELAQAQTALLLDLAARLKSVEERLSRLEAKSK